MRIYIHKDKTVCMCVRIAISRRINALIRSRLALYTLAESHKYAHMIHQIQVDMYAQNLFGTLLCSHVIVSECVLTLVAYTWTHVHTQMKHKAYNKLITYA